jgi:hypothetical protein
MSRYWITSDKIVIREWSSKEYEQLEPTICIEEEVLWNVCMNCEAPFSVASYVKERPDGSNARRHFCPECSAKRNRLFFAPKNRNNGYAYLMTKLHTVEFGEKEIDGIICPYRYEYNY